jgi:cell division protein FtsL
MSVASVLEREVKTTDKNAVATSAQNARVQQDELHNAQIKENYARILNPEFKREQISEIKPSAFAPDTVVANTQTAYPTYAQPVSAQTATPYAQPAVSPYTQPAASPYTQPASHFVQPVAPQTTAKYGYEQTAAARPVAAQNTDMTATRPFSARADSDIFRADSDINRVVYNDDISTPVEDMQRDGEMDEEDEDLMPTATTRQYKTQQAAQNSQQENKGFALNKKEKIMIGCFISLVILLFTVIIINSAIISSMSEGVVKLQNTYETVQDTYQSLQQDVKEAQQAENVLAKADQYQIAYTTNP